jgi:pimeloyl-ACP methyl ester carboxylesterase
MIYMENQIPVNSKSTGVNSPAKGVSASRRAFIAMAAGGLLAATRGTGGEVVVTSPVVADAAGELVVVDGVRLRFQRMGEGPPVVLIHGASGNLNDMTFRLAPALSRSHQVLAFDRPGHGLSGIPEGGASVSAQAALMRRALAQMGIGRSTVLGHSYGGSVALAWAVDAPESVEGLVLLAAPSQVWPGGLGLTTDLLANPIAGPLVARAATHLVTEEFASRTLAGVFAPQPAPTGYLEHLDLDLVLRPGSLRANAIQLSGLKNEIRQMVRRYPALLMPVEILHGEADRTVGLEIHSAPLAAQVPHARFTRLPGIGHMLHQVALPEVLQAMGRLSREA